MMTSGMRQKIIEKIREGLYEELKLKLIQNKKSLT